MNQKAILKLIRILSVVSLIFVASVQTHPVSAFTYVVDSNGDAEDNDLEDDDCDTGTGVCTLRAAIMQANAHAGNDEITFAINPTGPIIFDRIININTALPSITETVVITGPNSNGAEIVLDGGGGDYDGLTISGTSAQHTFIQGLTIRDFNTGVKVTSNYVTLAGLWIGPFGDDGGDRSNSQFGIHLLDGTNNNIGYGPLDRNVISGNGRGGIVIEAGYFNHIENNYIGTNVSGNKALLNGGAGIELYDSDYNFIGGKTPEERNVISGNSGDGIRIFNSSNNTVQGNYIGTDATGMLAFPNLQTGVAVSSSYSDDKYPINNLIGGDLSEEGNLISGNASSGILLSNVSSTFIQGNIIGLSANQSVALPNDTGILISNGIGNQVGGSSGNEGNVISGNYTGISIQSSSTVNTIVKGNWIGVNQAGAAFANGTYGIIVNNAINSVIGGTEPGEGNTIHKNQSDGVYLISTIGSKVVGNSIFNNNGLGIDLAPDGVTNNDLDDTDGQQNFPMIETAFSLSGLNLRTEGHLKSWSNTSFLISFYASQGCDYSGYGEGRTYLGSTTVISNSTNYAGFGLVLSRPNLDLDNLTVTAYNPNLGTSEFSACVPIANENVFLPLMMK